MAACRCVGENGGKKVDYLVDRTGVPDDDRGWEAGRCALHVTDLGRVHQPRRGKVGVVPLERQQGLREHPQGQDQRRRHHVRVRPGGYLLVC